MSRYNVMKVSHTLVLFVRRLRRSRVLLEEFEFEMHPFYWSKVIIEQFKTKIVHHYLMTYTYVHMPGLYLPYRLRRVQNCERFHQEKPKSKVSIIYLKSSLTHWQTTHSPNPSTNLHENSTVGPN